MAKTTRMYMVRRGRRYLIERNSDGTIKRWVVVGKDKKKKSRRSKK